MSKQVAALMVLLVLGGAVGIVVLMKAMTGTGAPIADNDAYQRLQRSVSSLEKELARVETELGKLQSNYDSMRQSVTQMMATSHTHAEGELADGSDAVMPTEGIGGLVDAMIEEKLANRGPGGRDGGAKAGKEKVWEPEKEEEKVRKDAEKAKQKMGLDDVQADQYAMIMLDEKQRKFEIEQQERDGSLTKEEAKELMNQLKEDSKLQLESILTPEQLEGMQKKGGKDKEGGGPGGKQKGRRRRPRSRLESVSSMSEKPLR